MGEPFLAASEKGPLFLRASSTVNHKGMKTMNQYSKNMNTKIKLVATDVDGTLCADSSPSIREEYFCVMRELLDKGVRVAITSGRQYPALARLFAPLREDLIFIADNGAQIRMGREDVHISQMTIEDSRELVRDVRRLGNGCECAYCVAGLAYFSKEDENVRRVMEEKMQYECQVVDSLEVLSTPCIKMSVYHPTDAEAATAEWFAPKWKKRLQVACAGKSFLDVMNVGTNKGTALRRVQALYGIRPEETMAFGDNINDLEMLGQAYYSFAVADARKEVVGQARFTAPPMREDGVLQVLEMLLARLPA